MSVINKMKYRTLTRKMQSAKNRIENKPAETLKSKTNAQLNIANLHNDQHDSELMTAFSITPLYNNDLIIALATLKRYDCTLSPQQAL